MRPRSLRRLPVIVLVVSLMLLADTLSGQRRTTTGDWPTYGADLASTRYLPLDQITASNFSTLEVAWRFKTDNLGPSPEFNFQSTPLVVGGMLYSTGGTRRAVFALNAATGELKWVFSLEEGRRGAVAPRQLSGRGLAYWSDGREERIVYVTPGYMMVALDAKTGRPVPAFGMRGLVDLKQGMDQHVDPTTGDVGLHAAPLIAKDVIVVGAAHTGGVTPKSRLNVKGHVRGYDVRTGKRLWIFHTVPMPGEFGHDTWLKDSASYTGNTGAWAQMSADEDLGLVYVPTETPTSDGYGGHRPGDNLFADTLLALDVKTGRRVWHFQTVHHDLWDFDLPCAPILADLSIEGRTIKAIAQPTKHGFLFLFDRTNGRPIWPIEERSVPRGSIPGEWYSPTQPFPTRPPPYNVQGLSEDRLIDFTPELRAEAVKLLSSYAYGPLFTPPVVSRFEGPKGLLMLPNATGGANWQGGSLDPETKIFYIFTNNSPYFMSMVPSEASDIDFIQAVVPKPDEPLVDKTGRYAGGGSVAVRGMPLVKPPYGQISAIDLNRGELLWQIAHGETPDNVRSHPALKGLAIPRSGRQGRIGTLVTKTLLIAGEGGFFTTPAGARGAMLRAYDKASGKEVGAVFMPAPQTGSPMTYTVAGQQFLVVAISGGTYSGELVAFALPGATPHRRQGGGGDQ